MQTTAMILFQEATSAATKAFQSESPAVQVTMILCSTAIIITMIIMFLKD